MMRALTLLLFLLPLSCDEDEQYTLPCSYDTQCEDGRLCREGRCVFECYLDSDCEGEQVCRFQRCEAPAPELRDGGDLFTPADAGAPDGEVSDGEVGDGGATDAAPDAA